MIRYRIHLIPGFTGGVPQDMLRYDNATLLSQGPTWAELESSHPPTVARWETFGWRVVVYRGGVPRGQD